MIDKRSIVDIKSRLNKTQARRLLSEFFNHDPNNTSFTKHAREQMVERGLIVGDVLNVLRAGVIHDEPEFEHGSWRYRVETSKITVVIVFNTPNKIKIITTWRNV